MSRAFAEPVPATTRSTEPAAAPRPRQRTNRDGADVAPPAFDLSRVPADPPASTPRVRGQFDVADARLSDAVPSVATTHDAASPRPEQADVAPLLFDLSRVPADPPAPPPRAPGPFDRLGVADAGLAGAASPLPHLERIQRLFGHYDLSSVATTHDPTARLASDRLGAAAFTVGNAVAFAEHPDVHTTAHEAAHVVQQRLGDTSDGEARADAVADAVVAGRPATPLLDRLSTGNGPAPMLQLKPKKLSWARVDVTFNAYLHRLGEVDKALAATKAQIGPPMPADYVPPPRRKALPGPLETSAGLLSDAELDGEVRDIRAWLSANPVSSSTRAHLAQVLTNLETEVRRRDGSALSVPRTTARTSRPTKIQQVVDSLGAASWQFMVSIPAGIDFGSHLKAAPGGKQPFYITERDLRAWQARWGKLLIDPRRDKLANPKLYQDYNRVLVLGTLWLGAGKFNGVLLSEAKGSTTAAAQLETTAAEPLLSGTQGGGSEQTMLDMADLPPSAAPAAPTPAVGEVGSEQTMLDMADLPPSVAPAAPTPAVGGGEAAQVQRLLGLPDVASPVALAAPVVGEQDQSFQSLLDIAETKPLTFAVKAMPGEAVEGVPGGKAPDATAPGNEPVRGGAEPSGTAKAATKPPYPAHEFPESDVSWKEWPPPKPTGEKPAWDQPGGARYRYDRYRYNKWLKMGKPAQLPKGIMDPETYYDRHVAPKAVGQSPGEMGSLEHKTLVMQVRDLNGISTETIDGRRPDAIGDPGTPLEIPGHKQPIAPENGGQVIYEAESFFKDGSQPVSEGRAQVRHLRASRPGATIVVQDTANPENIIVYKPGTQPPPAGRLSPGTPNKVPVE